MEKLNTLSYVVGEVFVRLLILILDTMGAIRQGTRGGVYFVLRLARTALRYSAPYQSLGPAWRSLAT